MSLDIVEKRILFWGIPSFLVIFLFFSFDLGMKIFYFSTIIFFLIFFFLCSYWAKEWHPERQFLIGFLVSILHTFLFIFSGVFGRILALFILKFSPLLLDYFRGMLKF